MPGIIKRWTVNCLPDDKTSAAVEEYANNPIFDDIIKGYRAGCAHGTKQFSFPHATSVHFEGTEEDFKAVVEFVKDWCLDNLEICAKLTTKPVLIDIPVGYEAYFTSPEDSNEETCWLDFNLEKEPFMPLHTAVVGFLAELTKSRDYEIIIINGKLEKHRPHLTGMRLAKAAKNFDLPAINLPADHLIKFTVSAGSSPQSGEYLFPLFQFNAKTIHVPAPLKSLILHQFSRYKGLVETDDKSSLAVFEQISNISESEDMDKKTWQYLGSACHLERMLAKGYILDRNAQAFPTTLPTYNNVDDIFYVYGNSSGQLRKKVGFA